MYSLKTIILICPLLSVCLSQVDNPPFIPQYGFDYDYMIHTTKSSPHRGIKEICGFNTTFPYLTNVTRVLWLTNEMFINEYHFSILSFWTSSVFYKTLMTYISEQQVKTFVVNKERLPPKSNFKVITSSPYNSVYTRVIFGYLKARDTSLYDPIWQNLEGHPYLIEEGILYMPLGSDQKRW